ncbi:HGGxSTG domain-containing protein [Stutzerimonas stutzeri]|uniref:HGGxSTG domain-containing protein n=1 Tax=Stutzerimonas stutzeri TaxID=316 RepID=UPI000D205741|nr:HGGxSTG domain-containing protein [Stutzerimonas stutzeri]AVX13810.1 hypothetical protein CXB48_13915 [Stutzerimonas stutzeri]
MAQCGAKTRSGQPCKAPAMPNGRCRKHGGTSTGAPAGNQNARKHGIYSAAIQADEADLWDEIAIGSLDDDIRIAKLQLRRALIAQAKAEAGDGLDVDSHTVSFNAPDSGADDDTPQKGYRSESTQRRRRDYEDIINRLLGRIGDLEVKRSDLLKANPPEQAPVARIEIEVVGGRTDAKASDDGAAG